MALKIKMPGIISKTYGKYWFPESEKNNMDDFQGISFWLKGDWAANFGNITISDRYGYAYLYCFELKNQEWHKINIGSALRNYLDFSHYFSACIF